ncbi:hypothetical protein LCL89_04180 [Halobacillus yeomjeoni]|uniref:hypothetical protein n=1 Tax=Halobacillus yeomjeoni TaxID=311194 RepID=UPI001CD3BDC4|nr:hypothetical protein [Halobacillus yeomjeoni]MCA0983246.1 hypothetical protein [Halobacillus yeomjeoni]
MQTNALFYKIHKETVLVEDYIHWSHSLLEKSVYSPSLYIIASFTIKDNIFEVEEYFKKALNELEVQQPVFEVCARAHIGHLANEIIKSDNYSDLVYLTEKIFHVVATELYYPDDLIEWYEISEMIDRLKGDKVALEFYEEDVISKVKHEAEALKVN